MEQEKQLLIGTFAKRANVSIRTLQYYDKIGLLKPTTTDERGRRLYQKRDLVVIHQIMTLKSLGLTLDEIKNHVMPVQNSQDVVMILTQQQQILQQQIAKAQKVIQSIDLIKDEINHCNNVDWAKYANMMALVQENNDYFWMSHFLDSDLMAKIADVHKGETVPQQAADWLKNCLEKAIELDELGVSPISDEAQQLIGIWWSYVKQYSNGNKELLQKLFEFYSTNSKWPAEFGQIQKKSQSFMQEAIQYYLTQNKLL